MNRSSIAAVLLTLVSGHCAAAGLVVEMHRVDTKAIGASVGTITVSETPWGLLFTPALAGLPGGGTLHGFHLHEKPDCSPGEKDGKAVAALGAGPHYDPAGTGKHLGPYAEGHLGDLPALYVAADGTATQPVLAPRVQLADLHARALVIHEGGDNYADHPHPLGGGGSRAVCGVVP